MEYRDWQELIPFYVNRTLPPEARRAFEAYLARCGTPCEQEVEEWRVIATAAWREGQAAVHEGVPPLSDAVYRRLAIHRRSGSPFVPDRVRKSTAITRPVQTAARPVSRVPLTLVAGIAGTLLFGALLIGLALRGTEPGDQPLSIAMLTAESTGTPGGVEAAATAEPAVDTALAQPTTTDRGPIPTESDFRILPPFDPTPTATRQPVTPPRLPPNTGGSLPVPPAGSPHPPGDMPPGPEVEALDENPAIQSVVGVCDVVNESEVPVSIHAAPRVDAAVTGQMAPGEGLRTYVVDAQGWYEVVRLGEGILGWVAPEDVNPYGACDSLLPPSPTATGTPAVKPPAQPSFVLVEAEEVLVWAQPQAGSPVALSLTTGGRLPLEGTLTALDGRRWLAVTLPDRTTGWVLDTGTGFTIRPADEMTPTVPPAPFPSATHTPGPAEATAEATAEVTEAPPR